MKKVGFIDYYLNEWHADNYPEWIYNQSGGEYKVCYAYGMIEPPFESGISNKEWAENLGIELLPTIEDVVKKSDCIVVLSPDNSEMHYELSKAALESGKPVFIDKTFANLKEEAEKIFDIAEESGAPVFSTSALRFSEKLKAIKKDGINCILSSGGGDPEIYLIHQLEPIATLMGCDFDKVMYIDNTKTPTWILHFSDGRTANISIVKDYKYSLKICYNDGVENLTIDDDFFKGLIDEMLIMFKTGKEPICHNDTIKIMSARESLLKAMKIPEIWVEVK